MKAVLEILKQYIFEIACGAVAIVAIALIVVGLGRMGDVVKEMEAAEQLRTQIVTASRSPNLINEKAVQQEEARIAKLKAGYNEVMKFVKTLDAHKPLIENAFPDPTIEDKSSFREAFREELQNWLVMLHAGDVPTEDYIAQERDRMEAEKPVDTSLGADATGEDTASSKPTNPYETAEVRAAIRNARGIQCYATLDSFMRSKATKIDGPMYLGDAPSVVDMWHAQLEVWVQRDLVEAIAAINSGEAMRLAAQAAKQQDAAAKAALMPWVGNLPIKDLLSVETTTYYVTAEPSGSRSAGSADRPAPPGSAETVFTGNKSQPLYELMQYTVKLVVDERDIPEILAGLSRNGFHTPLRVSYESVPPDTSMREKIYGDGPLVALVVDFETVFFSDLYLKWMPDEILKKLNKRRPEPPATDGA